MSQPYPATEYPAMERRLDSISADPERRCLRWLAHRMPRWVQPDHLTLLGLASMFMAGAFSAAAAFWPAGLLVANIWIALNWFGDSLDGTLARVRRQERPRYGYYVDHVADSFGVLFLFGGLAYSGYMSPMVAFAVLIGYFLLAINMYLAAYSIGIFQLSFFKVGPTELRVLLAIGNVIAWQRPVVTFFGSERLFFDVAGTIAVITMTFTLIVSVASNTVTLYRAEPVQPTKEV